MATDELTAILNRENIALKAGLAELIGALDKGDGGAYDRFNLDPIVERCRVLIRPPATVSGSLP